MSDVDTDGDDASISSAALELRKLFDQLRANDPRLSRLCIKSDVKAEYIEVFQALKENTSVKNIDLTLLGEYCTKGLRWSLQSI
jgi:hypothetical protein